MLKEYDFRYSVHEVDGKSFELIECKTWPRLNVQVLDTTPERFAEDVAAVKARSMCGYTEEDKTFMLEGRATENLNRVIWMRSMMEWLR